MRFHRKKHPYKQRFTLLLVMLMAVGWSVGFIIFASIIPKQKPPTDQISDVIVVLTGGSLRLEEGIRLLEAGAATRLFVSGVHRGVDVVELLQLQKREPDRLQCCITLGHDAENTIGNAQETADWAKKHQIQSIRLVTAGYHMPRSLLEFRAAMPALRITPHPVSPSHVRHSDWYKYPGTAILIAGEYTKFILAWIRLESKNLVLPEATEAQE